MKRRHAIITGGSSGIGLAIAAELLRRDHDVTLISRDPKRLASAKKQLRQQLPQSTQNQVIRCITADVCDNNQLHQAVRSSTASYPSSDLYCSAGFAHPGAFSALPLSVFSDTMAVNYFGSLHAVRALLPCLTPGQPCRIVLIASAAALIGVFGYGAYAPSKFAVMGLAEVLAAELGNQGIHISVAFPPDTDTPQLAYENRYKPWQTQRITQHAGRLSADFVGKTIVHQVQRRRFAITFNWHTTLLYWFNHLLKPALRWQFARMIRQTPVENTHLQ